MTRRPTKAKVHVESMAQVETETAHEGRCWVFCGKGGSGKSALLNAIASVMAQYNRPIVIYDMDDSNPTAKRFFQLPEEQIVGSIVEDEVGDTFVNLIWPRIEAGENVFLDLGGSGEVPFLKWVNQNDASEATAEKLIFCVVVGNVDGLGTARTVVENSPANQVLIFVNKSMREHKLATTSAEYGDLFEQICKYPNVVAMLDFPDVPYAMQVSSRLGTIIADVPTDPRAGIFEKGAARKALTVLTEAFTPIADYLP